MGKDREGDHLQAKKKDIQRNQACRHLDFGLPCKFLVCNTAFCGIFYSKQNIAIKPTSLAEIIW